MSIISRRDQDGVAVLTWDQPDSKVNVKSCNAMQAVGEAIRNALSNPSVKALVIASAKRDFVVGGDLAELQAVTTPDAARALVRDVRALMREMECAGKPVVAALNGKALGGGLEFALACHARVADSGATFGLPEVTLGLMPGAGGTQRLPRLIGAEPALKLLTRGNMIGANEAHDLGLVDEVVEATDLLDAAIARALGTSARQPWDSGAGLAPVAADLADTLRRDCAKRSGQGDIAERAIIDTVIEGLDLDFDAALNLEQERFAELVASPVAKNYIRTSFYALNRARAISGRPASEPPYELRTLAVVGAGTMGAGIAYTAAANGLMVRLVEAGQDALDRGMATIGRIAAREQKAGRVNEYQKAEVLGRFAPTLDYDALADVDLAIEAVVEKAVVKEQVLRKLGAVLRPGSPIASNTSTLPISLLAGYCPAPGDFLGLHFFGPVERMPLVEVVRGRATSDACLARSLDLLKLMRKTPIVVNDGIGFYTSRVVAAYTGEAMTLLAEGVSPETIDAAATGFGMAIGPCAMNDLTGLSLLIDIFESVASKENRPATRGNRSIEALRALVGAGRTGRRDGSGIYDYTEHGPEAWPGLAGIFPPKGEAISVEAVRDRLIYAQVVEAARVLEEGVVEDPAAVDIGSILGWMFPKWTGGVISYIDTVGARAFVDRAEDLAKRFGSRFEPPASLREMAATHTQYHPV